MKINDYIACKSSWLICAILSFSIALSPFSGSAANLQEVVGKLKWTYSVRDNTACILKVASVQGEDVEGVVDVPASFNGGVYVVTALGYRALSGLEYLSGVNIPQSVGTIGQECFRGCKRLAALKFPSMVQTIGSGAFYDCEGLRSVTLNEGLVSIGNNAFIGCTSLAAIVFPSTVRSIGVSAFSGTLLEAVELPDRVEEVGSSAFAECGSLETVTIGKGLKALPYRMFAYCDNLRSVTVKDGKLDSVNEECFRGCKRLAEVNISPTVKIHKSAFQDCPMAFR